LVKRLPNPPTLIPLAILQNDLHDSVDWACTWPYSANRRWNLLNARTDKVEPAVVFPVTERLQRDPKIAEPQTEVVEPILTKDLILIVDPMCT
jgi:hypothetical protein